MFRRGPSRWTLISKWHTDRDIIDDGDWYSGSFYPELCDLSPDGEHLIYFAAFADDERFQFEHQGWTGISKLPYLAPIVRVPRDDCWSGGGSFEDNRSATVWVTPDDSQPAEPPGFDKNWTITRAMRRSWREDSIYGARLMRDGWTREQECVLDAGYETVEPELRRKRGPLGDLLMTRSLEPSFVPSFELVTTEGGRIAIEGATWADWDSDGRLVYVAAGVIFAAVLEGGVLRSTVLHDFNDRVEPERFSPGD